MAASWCQAQDVPRGLSRWVGLQAPEGLPLIDPALSAGRAIVIHFTGDAGPDNIAQTIALNELRSRYGNEVIFLRAEDETAAGDRVFDSFGATRIPSVVVLDATGKVIAAFEGLAAEADLVRAIDEARAAGPPPGIPEGSVYDLSDPLPSPKQRVGHRAPASTDAIRAALEAGRTTVLAFLASYSRYHAEQEGILQALQELTGGALVVRVSADDATNEPAFSDYVVAGVPTLFVLSPDGVVRAHFDGLTPLYALATAVEAASQYDRPLAGPLPTPDEPVDTPPLEPEPPQNALTPHVPVELGAELEVGEPTDQVMNDPPLPGTFVDDSDPPARSPSAASDGDPRNPLSPAAGSELVVDSAVNEDYGPNRLVDGLLPKDPGFRPWVSSSGHAPPFEIRVRPARADLSTLVLHPATGDRSLFGPRWPRTIEILVGTADDQGLELLGRYELSPDGSDYEIELAQRPIGLIVIRVLSTHGGGIPCEMAEVAAR